MSGRRSFGVPLSFNRFIFHFTAKSTSYRIFVVSRPMPVSVFRLKFNLSLLFFRILLAMNTHAIRLGHIWARYIINVVEWIWSHAYSSRKDSRIWAIPKAHEMWYKTMNQKYLSKYLHLKTDRKRESCNNTNGNIKRDDFYPVSECDKSSAYVLVCAH